MAQAPNHEMAGNRTRVMIAVAHSFPYKNADAVILRRVGYADHDVILVRRGKLEPHRLAQAVGTIQAVHQRFGDSPAANALIRVQESAEEDRLVGEARNWVQLLGKVQTLDVPGIGPVQYIRLMLPSRN